MFQRSFVPAPKFVFKKEQEFKNNELSNAFLQFSNSLKNFVTLFGILRFISDDKPVIKIRDIKTVANNLKSSTRQKYGIIVFDTETTGLTKFSKENKKRNQITELAAITYNAFLQPDKKIFHGKVADEDLNKENSVTKIDNKISEIIGSDYKETGEFVKLKELFKVCDVNYKFDYKTFYDAMSPRFYKAKEDLQNLFQKMKLRKLNKGEKKTFENILDSSIVYNVSFYKKEIYLMESFAKYVNNQKTKLNLSKVFIFAHNSEYDTGMVLGCIEDNIKYWENKKENKSKFFLEKAVELKKQFEEIFKDSIDTQRIFKNLLHKKVYLDKIEEVQKQLGININFISRILKSVGNKRSVSLGKLNPVRSSNKVWHTATNDVYVTLETVRGYATIPIILSTLLALSGKEIIPKEIDSLIPQIIKDFISKSNFKEKYKNLPTDFLISKIEDLKKKK